MSEIGNRVVLVTGGASGLGRRIVLELARQGAVPVIWDIHQANLEKILREVERETGITAHGYLCDVTDRETVYATAERVRAEVGPVHVLVNNAGVVSGKPLLETPDEKIETTFQVNALSMFWTTKAFLPGMLERNEGHVVTVASAAGLVGVARLTDYSASKWAAVGFDESLRAELRPTGVKTTVVCPYFIDTGMFEGVRTRFPLLLPILPEEEVARRTVDAIRKNRARLFLPPLVYTVPVFRALPVAAFDAVADLLGINVAMESFVGRERAKKTRRPRPSLRVAEEPVEPEAMAAPAAAKRTRRPKNA